MLAKARCTMGGVIWVNLEAPAEKWVGYGVRLLPPFAGNEQISFPIASRDGTEWDWTLLGEWAVRFPAP